MASKTRAASNSHNQQSGTPPAMAQGVATNGPRPASSKPNNLKPSPGRQVLNDNTGFSEPFSLTSNTTLRHQEAVTDTDEDLDAIISRQKKHHLHPTFRQQKHHKDVAEIEKEMYKDLDTVDPAEAEKAQKGKLKRVFQKLPCTH